MAERLRRAGQGTQAASKRRGSDTAPSLTLLEYTRHVPEPKTGALNFDWFPFQPEIYETFGTRARDAVIRKCTQVGCSALLIRWALSESDLYSHTVLYVMPTLGDVFDFADGRITPLFEKSEYLWERKGDPFNKGLRKVGAGIIYFRGSENKRGLDSVDADCLALDEYDTLNRCNIPDAERRLSAVTSAGLIRRVGVPSLPEYGIASKYDESDRRMWLVRCSCGYRGLDREKGDTPIVVPDKRGGWQQLDFWRNVEVPKAKPGERRGAEPWIKCAGCGKPLDVAKGVWVPQQHDGDLPGFTVSRLMVPRINLREIVASSEKRAPFEVEVFYNKDLGLPFVSKEARLSPEDIAACQSHHHFLMVGAYQGGGLVTMGIDVASERALNVRISEQLQETDGSFIYRKKALWIGEIEDGPEGKAFEQLAVLMNRFNVHVAAIDAHPETRLARDFQQKFWGRVFLIHLTGPKKLVIDINWRQQEASVVRTLGMDTIVELVRGQLNYLPQDLPEGYVSHMTANIRRVLVHEMTLERKIEWHPTRPDDYAMAEVFDHLAVELWWAKEEVISGSQESEVPLDELIRFRRASVANLEDQEWRPGPGEDGGLGGFVQEQAEEMGLAPPDYSWLDEE